MKKALWTAFAGLCVAPLMALADEAGVTLYGVMDVGVAVLHARDADGARKSGVGLVSGGFEDSILGLQGSELLADGWRAAFQLESRFDAAAGELDGEQLFNNSAWLGVANDALGELRYGRQQTVAQQFASQLEVAPWKDMGMGATFKASDNYQLDNSVNYFSPAVGGFSVGLGYSFDVAGNHYSGQRSPHGSLALQYQNGPLLIVATWDKAWLSNTMLALTHDPSAWQLGVSYDFDSLRTVAAWSRQSNGYVGLDGGDPDDLGGGLGASAFAKGGHLDAYLAGISLPTGERDEVLLQWSYVDPHWSWADGSRAASGQLATLGYIHRLSHRSKLYLAAGFARHYSLDDQIMPDRGHATRVMMGLSHSF